MVIRENEIRFFPRKFMKRTFLTTCSSSTCLICVGIIWGRKTLDNLEKIF